MRSAHEKVGELVRAAEERKCRLADLPDALFPAPEVKASLGVANALAAFKSYGSTAPTEVERQLREWRQRLGI
jgi:argininosuccinate lyase